ncbi:chemoreceptor glutamine deamidase CheD [Cognatazoarcus halotolerans]|uniref:chemoreceptor glutamine deamidase CheD n=1 Tax=Cognatazoarcus halotolerans TaxID=2686016 RepID=UPI00135C8466|nr:chemoreceptor glutamine deamidase CheD [Cognatazoarcus halotolerans]MBX3684257.1 chemoreceptor glutamine deamidase CheD [Thauera sp.]MCB1900138.1 chemoreceptor glutamine deamidase CheD [Rhodocyclaceae bacterium]MCP5311321.1 chemoreceptor glutamine deamidase CheD [Zoogloeaceae bacterium]
MQKSLEGDWQEHLAKNRYFDRTFGCDAVKVLPGEYFVSTRDLVLVTVLGSCVTACIRDREKGIGGMNHFMLPHGGSGEGSLMSSSARYGAYAMEVLLNHLAKLGARRGALEAKIFGGGRVMASLASSQVGDRNARFVVDYLKLEGIPVVAQDLLDVYPRKVYYFPASGRVMVKKLVKVANDTVAEREREYEARLQGGSVAGEIELFG